MIASFIQSMEKGMHSLSKLCNIHEVLDVFIIIYSCINKLLVTCAIKALGLKNHVFFPFKMNIDEYLGLSIFCINTFYMRKFDIGS